MNSLDLEIVRIPNIADSAAGVSIVRAVFNPWFPPNLPAMVPGWDLPLVGYRLTESGAESEIPPKESAAPGEANDPAASSY